MRVVVCIRQGLDGEINPFDACAYEAALCLPNAEITLLSMAPLSAKDFLLKLTRLGAKKAILLTDSKFVGADTLATAYTLSLAIRKLNPDLTLCGRQTLIGDTGVYFLYAVTGLITLWILSMYLASGNIYALNTASFSSNGASFTTMSFVISPFSHTYDIIVVKNSSCS